MLDTIHTVDARVLAQDIPSESVDLILCDPVYQAIDDYEWLAEAGLRILKQNRPCIAFYSKSKALEVRLVMDRHLDYIYDLDYVVQSKPQRLVYYHMFCWTTPAVWYNKGEFFPQPWLPDTFISSSKTAGTYKWNKNPEVIRRWLTSYSKPGDTVFDPFTGSGVVPYVCKQLGRHYIACEIEPSVADMARKRLEAVEQFLPSLSAIQDNMFEEEE